MSQEVQFYDRIFMKSRPMMGMKCTAIYVPGEGDILQV